MSAAAKPAGFGTPAAGRDFELAVIGGGIVGLSIALHAAAAGTRTVLIERGILADEASGRSGGVVRQHGRRSAQLPLAARAVECWAGLERRLGRPTGFDRSGHVEVAASEEELRRQHRQHEEERAQGVPTRLLDAGELRRLVPGLGTGALGGKFCPADGYALPEIALAALADACRDAGVVTMTHTMVIGLEGEAARVHAVRTPGGRVGASVIVNAAGAWAPSVAQLAGVFLPIYPSRGHLAQTVPLPGFSEVVVASASHDFLAVPRPDGSYLVGSRQPDPTSFSYAKAVVPEAVGRLRSGLRRLAPALAEADFARSWAGTRECTPDSMPIIGWAPGFENFFICAGFSGEGFALAPFVGELVTRWLRGGERPELLAGYEVERFFQGVQPWASP